MNLKVSFGRIFGYLFLLLVYRWWSRLYRFIWERKYSNYPLRSYRTFDELAAVIRSCTWVKDGAKQLWDAFSYPGRVQCIIDTNAIGGRYIGDCDEFAVYLANVLEQSATFGGFENGRFTLAPWYGLMMDSSKILTVEWVDKNGKYGGHNVCLIEWFDTRETSHMDGTFSYMDYGDPDLICANIQAVLYCIMRKYAPDGTLLCWAIHDKNLNLQEVHLGNAPLAR